MFHGLWSFSSDGFIIRVSESQQMHFFRRESISIDMMDLAVFTWMKEQTVENVATTDETFGLLRTMVVVYDSQLGMYS